MGNTWNTKLIPAILALTLLASLNSAPARAADSNAAPTCMGTDSALTIDNERALELKNSNSGAAIRANVAGKVERIFKEQCNSKGTCHDHFEIRLGENSDDVLEVVYSMDFGDLPKLQIGDDVQACGDFINTNVNPKRGPASPSGAIIHWVHRSTCMDHESGFVTINGTLFGFDKDRKNQACKKGVAPRE